MVYFKRYRFVILAIACCCFWLPVNAQSFTMEHKGQVETIPFQLVRNLIVVKLKINNHGPYNFVLDTGVGYMLITEPSLIDSIGIESKRTFKIHGFGVGNDFEAYITNPLQIDVHGVVSNNVSAAIFKQDNFGLSAYAGEPIHGLLGYEFFNRLAVKIDFVDTTLEVSAPEDMRYYKRGAKIPISIEDRKPYLTSKVTFADGTEKQTKLIVDLGAGHFISLENLKDKEKLQKKFIGANLGVGINGLISGELSRIKEVQLDKYKVKNVIAAFPDDDKIPKTISRDGNLGIGLLKKFNVIFDYPNNALYLKPGVEFKRHDEHDMTGLTYYTFRDDYVHVVIEKVEPGSAGSEAGLQKGDEIDMINITSVANMSLQQIDDLFKSRDGRPFFLLVFRDKKYIPMHLTLKRRV